MAEAAFPEARGPFRGRALSFEVDSLIYKGAQPQNHTRDTPEAQLHTPLQGVRSGLGGAQRSRLPDDR